VQQRAVRLARALTSTARQPRLRAFAAKSTASGSPSAWLRNSVARLGAPVPRWRPWMDW
jgi:hypothetical protein